MYWWRHVCQRLLQKQSVSQWRNLLWGLWAYRHSVQLFLWRCLWREALPEFAKKTVRTTKQPDPIRRSSFEEIPRSCRRLLRNDEFVRYSSLIRVEYLLLFTEIESINFPLFWFSQQEKSCTDVMYWWSNPCLNGGTEIYEPTSIRYNCSSPVPIVGKHCEAQQKKLLCPIHLNFIQLMMAAIKPD